MGSNQLGERLKTLRRARKVGPQRVVRAIERLGVPISIEEYRAIEDGKFIPNQAVIRALSRWYGGRPDLFSLWAEAVREGVANGVSMPSWNGWGIKIEGPHRASFVLCLDKIYSKFDAFEICSTKMVLYALKNMRKLTHDKAKLDRILGGFVRMLDDVIGLDRLYLHGKVADPVMVMNWLKAGVKNILGGDLYPDNEEESSGRSYDQEPDK
ncbi:MAG: hypothetical protein QXI60_08520 [Thermofilaceae archaeon]